MNGFKKVFIGIMVFSFAALLNAAPLISPNDCTGSLQENGTLSDSVAEGTTDCYTLEVTKYSKLEFKLQREFDYSNRNETYVAILRGDGEMLSNFGVQGNNDFVYFHYLEPGSYLIFARDSSDGGTHNFSINSTVVETYDTPNINGNSLYHGVPTVSLNTDTDDHVAKIEFNRTYKETIGLEYPSLLAAVSWASNNSLEKKRNETDWYELPVVDVDTDISISISTHSLSSKISVALVKANTANYYYSLSSPSDKETGNITKLNAGEKYFFHVTGIGSYSFKINATASGEVAPTAETTQHKVAKLYVATFNRAADAAGLAYWDGSAAIHTNLVDINDIAAAIVLSDEYNTLYGGLTREETVIAMYANLFNKVVDNTDSGVIYWTNDATPLNLMILALINGAEAASGDPADAAVLANKTSVGIAFANAGMNDKDNAKNVMKNVTSDVSTVSTAISYITNNNIPTVNGPTSSNIVWLDTEPDGYFHWQEASDWCTNQGYRLPYMSELMEAWTAGGGVPSPTGFGKDTFYWSLDAGNESGTHKGCAMDYDCSTDDGFGWTDTGGNGHPKCVIAN